MSSQIKAKTKDKSKTLEEGKKPKIKERITLEDELPEGVTARLDGNLLTIKGPLGECKKDFSKIKVQVSYKENKVIVQSLGKKKFDASVANTVRSIIRKMIKGVIESFTYKLKIVFAHFPISVKTKDKNVIIENFYGERSPRIAKIIGDCKVTVEGDDVIVKGVSLEDVGQTAANIEQATKVKKKDQRIFLDGIYVYEKQKS